MSILRWIIGIPLVIVAIAFAVANGESVSFTYSPIHEPVNWPLYALVLAALAAGFIIGSVMTWAAGHAVRKSRTALAKENKKQQAEIERLTDEKLRGEALRLTAPRTLYDDEESV